MKRKRKRTTSSALNSSSKQQTVTSYYLPDECWESIFRFIIINDNDEDDCNNNNNINHYLNSLSLVSRQFLSVTNRLLFSLTVYHESTCCRLFKRFTNLNSLNLRGNNDLDKFLCQISHFPLKLTSLNISYQSTIPAIGLRAFSQKITTLTSLTCSDIHSSNSLDTSDLFLIAECFPLLEELDLSHPSSWTNYSSFGDGLEALSLALIKLRKFNLSRFPINDKSLFHLFHNCKHLDDVIMFGCRKITYTGLASALRERPTLSSLSFNITNDNQVFATSYLIDSLVNLKGLTSLDLRYLSISDELLYSIARERLPLIRLYLCFCINYSYNGIFCLLSKCQSIKYLDLQEAYFLQDQHVVQLSPFLRDLVSIDLSLCPKLTVTQSTLFTLAKNCPSLRKLFLHHESCILYC